MKILNDFIKNNQLKCVVGFQKDLDFSLYKFIFKLEYDTSKYITICTNDLNDIVKIKTEFKNLYEVIPEKVPVREYYDIDLKVEDENIDFDQETENIVKDFLDVRNICDDGIPELNNKDLVILTSHRSNKISIHIISLKTWYENNDLQKLFVIQLNRKIKEYNLNFSLDDSVYSKNRLFRCLGCSKLGRKEVLKVYNTLKYNNITFSDSLLRLYDSIPPWKMAKYKEEDLEIKEEFKDSQLDTEADIITLFLSKHKEYSVRCYNQGIIKLNRVRKGPCFGGNDRIHETQDACIYEKNNNIYLNCFCGDSVPVKIGVNNKNICTCKFNHNDMISVLEFVKSKFSGSSKIQEFVYFLSNYSENHCFEELVKYLGDFKEQDFRQDFTKNWSWISGFIPNGIKYIKEKTFIQDMIKSSVIKEEDIKVSFKEIFDENDDFYDFFEYMRKTVFPSKGSMIRYFADNLDRYVKKVLFPSCFIVNKKSGITDIEAVLEGFTLYIDMTKEGPVIKRMNLFTKKEYSLINSDEISTTIPIYKNITFRPNQDDVKKGELNMFQGFKAKLVENVDMDLINPILYHIKKCWANNDENIYDYILQWFRNAFLFPWNKNGTVIILYSEEGSGKTMIIDNFIIPFVYGNSIASTIVGLSPIVQRFNSILINKLFILANEVSSGDHNFVGSFEILKSLITDKTLTIEKKGIDIFNNYPNYINFIFTTNNPDSVRLGRTDRRYVCLEAQTCFLGNFEYFNKLSECFNQETANHFFTYICGLEKTRDIRQIPSTELRVEMLKNSTSSIFKFFEDVKDYMLKFSINNVNHKPIPIFGDYNWDIILSNSVVVKNNQKIIINRLLYEVYKRWCKENYESIKPSNSFSREANRIFKQYRDNSNRYWILS